MFHAPIIFSGSPGDIDLRPRMSRLSCFYRKEQKKFRLINGLSMSLSELEINKGVSAFLTNNDTDNQESPETGERKPGNFFCDL
jgi:hypothetical protein